MTDHDLDLYSPLTEEVEPEHLCSTCRHFDPCPCGCEWGVCRNPFCRADYVTGLNTCEEWEEE